MVEQDLAKVQIRVRFPVAAPKAKLYAKTPQRAFLHTATGNRRPEPAKAGEVGSQGFSDEKNL